MQNWLILEMLATLESVDLMDAFNLTDTGLEHLKGLTQLQNAEPGCNPSDRCGAKSISLG